MVTNGEGTSPILRVYRRDEDGSEANVTFIQKPTLIYVQTSRCDPLVLHQTWDVNLRTCLLTDHASNMTYKVWERHHSLLASRPVPSQPKESVTNR